MKKIFLAGAIMAAALSFYSFGNKGNDGSIDAGTQAELDKQLAGMATYESEGAEFAQQQLKADPALKKTASGLIYKLITPGNGNNFKESDNVNVIYTGSHVNGQVFDSSNGKPVTFPVSGVVPGFKEMLLIMKPGAKAHCIIPGNLGYGERGNQGIAPNETLVFDIETVGLAQQ